MCVVIYGKSLVLLDVCWWASARETCLLLWHRSSYMSCHRFVPKLNDVDLELVVRYVKLSKCFSVYTILACRPFVPKYYPKWRLVSNIIKRLSNVKLGGR